MRWKGEDWAVGETGFSSISDTRNGYISSAALEKRCPIKINGSDHVYGSGLAQKNTAKKPYIKKPYIGSTFSLRPDIRGLLESSCSKRRSRKFPNHKNGIKGTKTDFPV
jgi:hypothetical protein